MSASNGTVLKFERKGFMKIQWEDRPPFEIDVIAVHNQWLDIDRGFYNDKGEIPPEASEERNRATYKFVTSLFAWEDPAGSGQVKFPPMSMTNVLEFMKAISDKCKELYAFFEPSTSGAPSSPESTEVIFSP